MDRLEAEYDIPHGFIWKCRQGTFDPESFERFLGLLKEVQITGDTISQDLVRLLWFVPVLMEWNTFRVEENGGDVHLYESAKVTVINHLEDILGVP